jgi:polysaccharide chain length determinant protein (PEP-CTERM system associated)
MLGHRELSFEDYAVMLRRRLWVIVIPTLIVPILAYVVSLKLPNRYTSRTLVLVENQKVPENYVKPVVSQDLYYRLQTMQEQILSRTRLQPIIERFRLYSGNLAMEEKLAMMRKATLVKPIPSKNNDRPGEMPGFSISFTYDQPRMAQQVCGEITSMFIDENLKARQQSAQGTTQFLQKQLEDSKKKLDEQDARLAKFKAQYLGQLPDQAQTNMNVLMGLRTQLDAVTQALARAQQDKTYTESVLAQQLAAWEATQKEGSSASPSALQQQLATLQTQLVSLQSRYTEDYPDVVKTKRDIEQLKRQLQQAESSSPKKPANDDKTTSLLEPPQIQQLRLTVRQYEQTLQEKTREQERLQHDIQVYQGRVQLTPMVEEQYKALTRDYQTALNFYNDLLAKKSQSEMATDLELRQQGEQFRVMDPPNLPVEPSFPNRPLITLGGVGGGLGLGLILAFGLEMMDKSLRNEADVQFYLKLPALVSLPVVGEGTDGDAGKNGNRMFWRRKKQSDAARQHVGV